MTADQTLIDEERLTAWLAQLAEDIELPADGAETILAVRSQQDHMDGQMGRPHRRARILLGLAAVAAIAVVGTMVVGFRGDRPQVAPVTGSAISNGPNQSSDDGFVAAPPTTVAAATATTTKKSTIGGADGAAGGAASGVARPPAAVAAPAVGGADVAVASRVVKTGTVDLEIGRGNLADVTSRLTALAVTARGFVAASSTTDLGETPSATVTIRVPAASFEDTFSRVRTLGRVIQSKSQGQDVTAQYVDLDARLHSLSATRQQYVTLLSKANTIGDILNVQQHITDLQTQIEQLQGQQKVLADQSDLGTLEVHLSSAGASVGAVTAPEESSGMAKAWHRAVSHFVSGVESVVAASGVVAFALVMIGAALLLGRALHPVLRRRLL